MNERRDWVPLGAIGGFLLSTVLVYLVLSYLGKVSGFNGYFKIIYVIFSILLIGILLKIWFGEWGGTHCVGFFADIKEGFKLYGEVIATVVNSVLLTIVYVIGVGLTSIFTKVIGKKFLEMKIDDSSETYWNELNIGDEDMDSHYKQF